MNIERTLSIIKPDAVKKNIVGKINSIIEDSNLCIIAQKRILLTESQARDFYKIHENKFFFRDLYLFMSSGPIIVQVLEGFNAIEKYRKIIGSTNPFEANPGTIRSIFAESIEKNVVHGSDSVENANVEIRFFFSEIEMIK